MKAMPNVISALLVATFVSQIAAVVLTVGAYLFVAYVAYRLLNDS